MRSPLLTVAEKNIDEQLEQLQQRIDSEKDTALRFELKTIYSRLLELNMNLNGITEDLEQC